MVEFVLSINLSSEKKFSYECDNCSENQAINWCERCDSHYCESCTKSLHSNKALQSHIIISLQEKVQSFCLDHPAERFTSWCKKCAVPVCDGCLLFQHQHHKYLPLKDAATEAKMKLQETVEEIGEIRRNLTTSLETAKSIINQQSKVVNQEKQNIEQMFANLHHKLEERKREIIKELEDNDLQTKNILDRQRVIINQHLNLTTVQELCVKKILDSNDPMQILKSKSALYRNHNNFLDQYNKIDDGYMIKTYSLKKYEKDVEQILQMISKIGHSNSESWMVKGDTITIKTSYLDIPRTDGNTGSITGESNIAHGYKFLLKKSLKLRSIQIHSDHVGQIIGFVVNDADIIIQKGTINSTNPTMKWLRIPIECDVKNNYTILVLTLPDNPPFNDKNVYNQPRIINQNCTVESKCAQSVTQINVGSNMIADDNTSSIDMILDVEG
jgi:hypothetical protein